MIALLVGQPIVLKNHLIMMVNGVGYGVTVSQQTLSSLMNLPEAKLFIYTHVREDALDLFGFLTPEEKELFELLISVSGVGPKTGVNILDVGVDRVVRAVQQADVSLFASVPRVGKKVAQKIIIELKPKLGSLQELNLGPRNAIEQDVVDALEALGFSELEIQQALQSLNTEAETNISVLVTQAIKILGSHPTKVTT